MAGCAGASSGAPALAVAEPNIVSAYLPLHGTTHLGLDSADGAAVVIAPGIAVSNDHNSNMVDRAMILGFGSRSDLMFFRTSRGASPQTAPPVMGEAVIAYGQGGRAELRVARGVVCNIAQAPGSADSPYFVFAGNAGPGFSGGSVLDSKGNLVGITAFYLDKPKSRRLIFAYDMKRVWAEFQRKQPKKYEPGENGPPAPPPDLGGCIGSSR